MFTRPALPPALGPREAAAPGPAAAAAMGCLGNSKTEDQRNEEKAQREANKKIEEAAAEGPWSTGPRTVCCCWVLENLVKAPL